MNHKPNNPNSPKNQDRKSSEASEFETRRTQILDKIATYCQQSNRPSDAVELLAVSKGHSYDKIKALVSLGQSRFGENYLQEMEEKAKLLAGEPAYR